MKVEKELPGIKKNILLKNHTTFKIGGKAKYFLISKKKEDLVKAILAAKKFRLPFFILGGGSNLLISDKGFKGLVIKILNTKYKILNTKIVTEAGTILGQLVSASEKAGLAGLEWAIGIPGTVGGAVYGNTGSFGKSMKDIVKEVEIFDAEKQKIRTMPCFARQNLDSSLRSELKILKKKDYKFGYRDSIFKRNPNLIILSATLELKKGNKKEVKRKIGDYLNFRRETQPLNFPSAGSIFKNPLGFSVGELIEKCGLKGKIIGEAQISKKHANFIVNLGDARAKDVKKLINLAKNKVKKKFKINLEEEIQYLGFKN